MGIAVVSTVNTDAYPDEYLGLSDIKYKQDCIFWFDRLCRALLRLDKFITNPSLRHYHLRVLGIALHLGA